eukprot:SAG31_NODE_11079_length_1068_cov_1.283798_1_plen_253_part_01
MKNGRRLQALASHFAASGTASSSRAAGSAELPPHVRKLLDMTGKVCIVTGGGTHLGTAMATALGQMGATVVIASRRADMCRHVAARMRASEGIRVFAPSQSCDATLESDVDALVADVVNKYGRLDCMVCNAGGSVTSSYLPNASIAEFTETWEMNAKSTYLCAQSAARQFIAQQEGQGSIITLGSIHSFLGSDKRMYPAGFKRSGPPYQSAKGAILNLTRGLAADLGEQGITVNCISPGQIPRPDTDPAMVEA